MNLKSPVPNSAEANILFNDLRGRIARAGHLEPDGRGTLLRLLGWAAPLCGLMYAALTTSSVFVFVVTALLLSLLQAQFAFIGHDASHGSAARSRRLNRVAGQISMGVVSGLCFQEWRQRHLLHHRHCQDERNDPDMQFGTLFSMSAETLAARTPFGRWLGQYQAYYFWPSTLLFAFSLRICAFAAALRQPHKYRGDLAAVTAHIALYLVLPLALPDVTFTRIALLYLLTALLLGPRLAAVFTVNHVGMPAASPDTPFIEHQASTSRNVRVGRWMEWFFGGLNYQIEHHLLPSCPRNHLRQVREHVRPQLLAFGLPHRECNWLDAVTDVTRHLDRVAASAAQSNFIAPRPRSLS